MMEGFVDLHCHILPGLDDGSKDIHQTGEMLQFAYEEGIRKIIATPHNYASHKSASPERIMQKVKEVNELAKKEGIDITVYPGNEIFYRSGVAEQLDDGQLLTMAGTRFVLLEFYPDVEWSYFYAGIQELQRYGYYPIIAHCERYDCLYRKKEYLDELTKSGIALQVNASSFLQPFGNEWRKRSRMLLKKGMITYIGTDAHNTKNRLPRIQQCANFLNKRVGADNAERLLIFNAEKYILNRKEYDSGN